MSPDRLLCTTGFYAHHSPAFAGTYTDTRIGRLHYHSGSLRPVEIYLLTKRSVILELGMIAIIRGFRVIDGMSARTTAETNSPSTGNEVRP